MAITQSAFRNGAVGFIDKKEIDVGQSLDYGLVAEDVAEVDRNLAIRDARGRIESVLYTAINAMLLNEFLKEHTAFIEEQRKVEKLEATVAQQHKDFEAAVADLRGQIQKVSSQLELSKAPPQTVLISH